jgi:hypothetical protein
VKITAEDVLALRPCWDEPRLRAAIGKGMTYREIATAAGVSVGDRRWVLTRLAARTREGRTQLVLWAAGCAQDVRDKITNEDLQDATDCAIQTAVAVAMGSATAEDAMEARRQVSAAYAAAYAAYAAADTAAYAAAYAADTAAADTAYAADTAAAAAYAAYAADTAAAAYAEKQLLDLASALESLAS